MRIGTWPMTVSIIRKRSASSQVRPYLVTQDDRCVPLETSVGLTLRTMTLVVPWRRMSSRASSMLPLPNAIRAMTAAVPMMMPSTDRIERSLCSQRLRRASTKLLRHLSQTTAHGREEPGFGGGGVGRCRHGELVGEGMLGAA